MIIEGGYSLIFTKKDGMRYFFILFLSILYFFLISAIGFYDNVDVFFNARNIQLLEQGYIAYKDINIITTPFFHFLGVIFFKIFGCNFWTIDLYCGIVNGMILTIIVYIMDYLKISRTIKAVAFIFFVFCIQSTYYFSYNMLLQLIILLILMTEVCLPLEKNSLKKLILGILLGLLFLTKQTIGIIGIIVYLIKEIIDLKNNKKSIKMIDKALIIGFILSIIPFCIYIFDNNCFYYFVDLCFNGIKEFGERNLLFGIGELSFVAIFLVFDIYIIKKSIKNKSNEKATLYYIALLGLITLFNCYPICVGEHVLNSIIVSSLGVFYWLSEKEKVFGSFSLNILKVTCIFFFITLFVFVIYPSINGGIKARNTFYTDERAFFNGYLAISQREIDNIVQMHKFTVEQKNDGYDIIWVTRLVSKYLLPYGEYNYKYDVLGDGNFGADGYKNVTNYIKKVDKPLIIHSFNNSYQESKEIHQFLLDNYCKREDLANSCFEIYTKRD